MSLAFIACVESGFLEDQAMLLFRSIRKYAGKHSDAPIYSFQPRTGPALRRETLEAFEHLGVVHSTKVLNSAFHNYPIGNKIFVCAHAEETLTEDILVFTDSDTVFLAEPTELDLPQNIAAGVRPVDNANCAPLISGTDPFGKMWDIIYATCGVSSPPEMETPIDRVKIHGYWNAGLIAARREHGIFEQWMKNFLAISKKNATLKRHLLGSNACNRVELMKTKLRLMASTLLRDEEKAGKMRKKQKALTRKILTGYVNNLDQFALSATLARFPGKVRQLGDTYNYPISKKQLMPQPLDSLELDELVHIHYHRWFNRPDFLKDIRPELDQGNEKLIWMESFLPFEPKIHDRIHSKDS